MFVVMSKYISVSKVHTGTEGGDGSPRPCMFLAATLKLYSYPGKVFKISVFSIGVGPSSVFENGNSVRYFRDKMY